MNSTLQATGGIAQPLVEFVPEQTKYHFCNVVKYSILYPPKIVTNLRHSNIHGHAKPEESDKEEHVSLRAAGADGRRGSANRRKRRARRPTWFDNDEPREARDMLALPSYFRNSKRFNFSGFLIAVNAQDVVESVSDLK